MSRLPQACQSTIRPLRARSETAPAYLPSLTNRSISAWRRPSRSDDIPCDAGVARGNGEAGTEAGGFAAATAESANVSRSAAASDLHRLRMRTSVTV